MRIEVERSGGFAGVSVKAAVDTAELTSDEAIEFEALVSRLNLSELSERHPSKAQRGADRFQYDIAVSDDRGQHRISLTETELTAELRQLVTRVLQSA